MGGRLEAVGQVTGMRADLEGRMSAVDVADFLEGTDGLGQSTLLPRHVRGQAWAEGRVGYAFGRKEGVPWDADVLVRIEEGELIDFDPLQLHIDRQRGKPNPLQPAAHVLGIGHKPVFPIRLERGRNLLEQVKINQLAFFDAHQHVLSLIHISEPTRPY